MDEILLYRASDLIVSDSLIVNSVDTQSLLLLGSPILTGLAVTQFTSVNLNSGGVLPITLTFDTIAFNDMASFINKSTNQTYTVLVPGTYYVTLTLNVAVSSSSINVFIVKNGTINIVSAVLSPSDGGCSAGALITFALADTFQIQAFKASGSNNNAKVLSANSSVLSIRKLF